MAASSSARMIHSFHDSYTPKRDANGLIEAHEYAHVLGRRIPDLKFDVTLYDNLSNPITLKQYPLYSLLHDNHFVLCFQPGASTIAEAEHKLYSTKAGAPGCTGELINLDSASGDHALGKYRKSIIICSTKTSEQQVQVIKERAKDLPYKNIQLISDPTGELGKALGLFLTKDTLINSSTGEKQEIVFYERIMLLGKDYLVTDYICAAEMPHPLEGKSAAENAKALPQYVRAGFVRSVQQTLAEKNKEYPKPTPLPTKTQGELEHSKKKIGM